MAIDLNPTILGRPLFPSSEKFKEYGRTIAGAFTPAAGTPPSTMAGVTVPPAGASLSQLQFKGPLLGTGPQFGLRGTPAPTPQPEPVKTDIGAYAATRFPFSFDVAKTQTPSMQQPNIAALTGGAQLPSFTPTTQAPIMPSKEPRQMIQTPYGTIYATAGQKQSFESKSTRLEGRTPAQQQALLAQMREKGGDMAKAETERQKQLTKDYYAFLQSQAEKTMQEALTPKFGGVGQESKRRAEQAMVEASRFAEGARTGKAPFATENITTPYGEVFRSRSGRYFPVAKTSGFSGFAPQFQLPSVPAPSGFISSGYMPSFSNLGPQTRFYL